MTPKFIRDETERTAVPTDSFWFASGSGLARQQSPPESTQSTETDGDTSTVEVTPKQSQYV